MKEIMKNLLKYIWLTTTVIALSISVHSTMNNGFSESYPFYIITIIALLMFLFRRKINNIEVENK